MSSTIPCRYVLDMSEDQKSLGLVRFMWECRIENVFCGYIGYLTMKYWENAKRNTTKCIFWPNWSHWWHFWPYFKLMNPSEIVFENFREKFFRHFPQIFTYDSICTPQDDQILTILAKKDMFCPNWPHYWPFWPNLCL